MKRTIPCIGAEDREAGATWVPRGEAAWLNHSGSTLVALGSGTARPGAEGTRGTKGAPGPGNPQGVARVQSCTGSSAAACVPLFPAAPAAGGRGAGEGPGLTGARKDGGRDGRTDGESGGRRRPGGRRRRCRGPATSQCGRAAGAAPRAPQRARAGGDTPGRRGAEPGDATTVRGRPTDRDRPPGVPVLPTPLASSRLPGVPGRRTCCLCLPRAFTSAASALPRRLSPLFPSYFWPPLSTFSPASPLASLSFPARSHPPSSLEMKSPLTTIHESTAATSLVPKPFQGSSIKPGKDTLGEKEGGPGPGKLLCLRSVLAERGALARRLQTPTFPSPSLAHPGELNQGVKGQGWGIFT